MEALAAAGEALHSLPHQPARALANLVWRTQAAVVVVEALTTAHHRPMAKMGKTKELRVEPVDPESSLFATFRWKKFSQRLPLQMPLGTL
jgi:hypothetical protein